MQVSSEPVVSLKRRAGSWIQAESRGDICVLASPNLSPIWSDIRVLPAVPQLQCFQVYSPV